MTSPRSVVLAALTALAMLLATRSAFALDAGAEKAAKRAMIQAEGDYASGETAHALARIDT
ncbi:MAG: hypothetical protein ACRELY_07770, partial [Polyangiaceae bacterium]